jgi:hypothetical protein
MRASISVVSTDGVSISDEVRAFPTREALEARMAEFAGRIGRFKTISSIRAISADGQELVDAFPRDVLLRPDGPAPRLPRYPRFVPKQEEPVWPTPEPDEAPADRGGGP